MIIRAGGACLSIGGGRIIIISVRWNMMHLIGRRYIGNTSSTSQYGYSILKHDG